MPREPTSSSGKATAYTNSFTREFSPRAKRAKRFGTFSVSAAWAEARTLPGFSAADATCDCARLANSRMPPPVAARYESSAAFTFSRTESAANRAYAGSTAAYVPKVSIKVSASAVTL